MVLVTDEQAVLDQVLDIVLSLQTDPSQDDLTFNLLQKVHGYFSRSATALKDDNRNRIPETYYHLIHNIESELAENIRAQRHDFGGDDGCVYEELVLFVFASYFVDRHGSDNLYLFDLVSDRFETYGVVYAEKALTLFEIAREASNA